MYKKLYVSLSRVAGWVRRTHIKPNITKLHHSPFLFSMSLLLGENIILWLILLRKLHCTLLFPLLYRIPAFRYMNLEACLTKKKKQNKTPGPILSKAMVTYALYHDDVTL